MPYLVRWGCFIMDDSLSPVEAAAAARERSLDDNNQMWHVTELESGTPTVVNLATGTVVGPSKVNQVA